MLRPVGKLLIGSPLPNSVQEHECLTKVKALAVFSSDALSSVAYATEEILLVLVLAGAAGLPLATPIGLFITALIIIVATSYYQTVHAYPSGGGSYIVSHENLGVWSGLAAAAALLVDYVLTVSVSVSAGVHAITSAFPQLFELRVEMCLLLIFAITLANMRGLRESGTIFAIPTYVFVFVFLSLLITGFAKLWFGTITIPPVPVINFPEGHAHPLTLLLLLRAFASGCTALTGIEAVSNGVPAFKKPKSHNAGVTLIAMAALLTVMFLGVTFLASALHIVPDLTGKESVASQIGRLVFGNGFLYYFLQGSTALILVLAANTSFADFPRLSSILARDGYMPRQFANIGDRLVFSNGIAALAILSSLLVLLFHGETHQLIPLYAVGVFLSFTLSQAGMVTHWLRVKEKGWYWKIVINGLGAITTGVVSCIIIESKFIYGAWIVILVIPLIMWFFKSINDHFRAVVRQIALPISPEEIRTQLTTSDRSRYRVMVPLARVDRGSLAALQFARSLSDDVTAVTININEEGTKRFRQGWEEMNVNIPLVVLESPYRSVIKPLLDYLIQMDLRGDGETVIVLPEFVPAKWWQNLLHNQTALMLKAALLYSRETKDRSHIIINVPYHLRR